VQKMNSALDTTLSIFLIAVVILLIFVIFRSSLKLIFKLLLHSLTGFLTLTVVNLLGSFLGVHIAVTLLSCLVAGILGLPGVILLLLFM